MRFGASFQRSDHLYCFLRSVSLFIIIASWNVSRQSIWFQFYLILLLMFILSNKDWIMHLMRIINCFLLTFFFKDTGSKGPTNDLDCRVIVNKVLTKSSLSPSCSSASDYFKENESFQANFFILLSSVSLCICFLIF